ncbi:MAG: rhomboid family intramembrane serine protease, partial [Spirochaetes bacterium]|nr:rhomboid family intramembrane serine protease [Spirochaetota bacterium]
SGAVFGLLLAFGILFPDVEVLLFFIIPVKARTLVILYGGLELFLELSGGFDSISHIGHLGGLATGIVYFIITRKHAIRYKTRGFVAIQKKKETIPTHPIIDRKEVELQKTIVQKIRTLGESALTDDEVQYIRYKEIMVEVNDVQCDKDIFDYVSCENCSDRDACFIKIVKKLLNQ